MMPGVNMFTVVHDTGKVASFRCNCHFRCRSELLPGRT
jgi:hypothetical protein